MERFSEKKWLPRSDAFDAIDFILILLLFFSFFFYLNDVSWFVRATILITADWTAIAG